MIYVFFLLLVTAVWGWTFVLVKDALTHYPTLPFLQLRFILAFLILAALVRRMPTRREMKVGAIAGAVLAAGYLTQTVGLTMTSPGNSGLITGLFVVFTPLIDRLFGAPLRWFTLLAVAIALAGTVLLVGGPSGFGLGDILTVACAFLYALHIVLLSRWSPGLRPAPLAMLQMGTGAVIFSAGGSWSLQVPSPDVWLAIVVTGVFASALAFYVQTWAQQHLSASRTALILTTEPAWAVVAAVVLAGQRFGPLQAIGAALMLAAIVGHELAHLKFKAHGVEATT
ncbi:MAG TPA: EamA family transporter [Chloroflexi bacterium]|nr:EamA family transporter [Chloroflexota bacterium]HAF20206.1 EamA family transporter [Chloroflexota bacterium]